MMAPQPVVGMTPFGLLLLAVCSTGLLLSPRLLSDTSVSLLFGSSAGRAITARSGEDSPAFIAARLFIACATPASIVFLSQCQGLREEGGGGGV